MKYCYNCMAKLNDGEICRKCSAVTGSYEVQPHHLMPGLKLRSRYIVGNVIGEGGFGITYIGMDEYFDEKVAIKEFYMKGFVNRNNTYSPSISSETGNNGELFSRNKEKFLDEARVLVKVGKEDGIVKVRDFFYENNTAYIIMDYLEGKTLKDLLKDKKVLSVEETLNLLKPILFALAKLHSQNIIHRDISPDNIIITEDGKPWLIDFGAAREFAEDDVKSLSVILKPGYAPEEQYRRKGVQGPWTDIYAICATMYRCICGKRPEDALERIVEDETEELCQLVPSCPKHISDVIMKGLSVRQNDRYQNVEDLIDELWNNTAEGEAEAGFSTEKEINVEEPILETEDNIPTEITPYERTVMVFSPDPNAQNYSSGPRMLQNDNSAVQNNTYINSNQIQEYNQVSNEYKEPQISTLNSAIPAGLTSERKKGIDTKKNIEKKKKIWIIPVVAGGALLLVLCIIIIALNMNKKGNNTSLQGASDNKVESTTNQVSATKESTIKDKGEVKDSDEEYLDLKNVKVGDVVTIKYYRDGKTATTKVTLQNE